MVPEKLPDCPRFNLLTYISLLSYDEYIRYYLDLIRLKELEEENKRLWENEEDRENRTSDSDESNASRVSFKSDMSKDKILNFKGQLSPWSVFSSPLPSPSEGEDVAADDGDSELTSDGNESTASSVSFKSDWSKEKIIDFKVKLSPRFSQKRRASTGSSCASIKSEGSPGHIKAKKRRSE